ncbi:MAG: PQQ-dependent sugar dehydrogenase [Pseudomonadota bacterium]
MKMRTSILAAALIVGSMSAAQAFGIKGTNGTALEATEIATFDEPWAMTFLPDGSMLVNEKSGSMIFIDTNNKAVRVAGVPDVQYGGQGGLGDVIAHPDFEENNIIYFSYVERNSAGTGAVVARAKINMEGSVGLSDIEQIWEQTKMGRAGHFSHKLAIGADNKLFITSGDRQLQKPAQDMSVNLGKVVRLNLDGSIPADNPIQDQGDLAKTFWTVGHRNLLGIDFDSEGRLWTHEMGPRHGDELNLIEPGTNYGWPIVSNGRNYSGIPIPNHDTRPEFNAPEAYWVPSIAPSGLVIYDGDVFGNWQGDALIGGLVSRALIHVALDGINASESERFEWGSRIREVEQGPDGSVYVLEDGDGGRLLKLEPA